MSHSVDPSSSAAQFLQTLQSDLQADIRSESAPDLYSSAPDNLDAASELATLRDFNAKLLERISEIRRRNFELSKLEDKARTKDTEISQLREQEQKMRAQLSKLTDESWAKDLEIRQLRESFEKDTRAVDEKREKTNRETIERYQTEIEDLRGTQSRLSEQAARTTQDLVRAREEIRAKQDEFETLKKDNADAAARLQAEIEDEFRRSDQRLNALQVEHADRMAQIELERSAEKKGHTKVQEELQARIKSLEYFRNEQTNQLAQTSSALMDVESRLNATRAELDAKHEDLVQERELAIEALDAAEKRAVQKLQDEVDARESRIRLLEKQLAERESMLEEARLAFEESRRSFEASMRDLRTDFDDRYSKLETETQAKLRSITDAHDTKQRQLTESAHEMVRASEDAAAQALREANERFVQLNEQTKKRETDLNLELCSLRAERASMEKRLAESSEKIVDLRAQLDHHRNESRIEIRNLKNEAEQALNEMQARLKAQLQAEFREKFEVVLTENARLQGLLEVEDNSTEVERRELQKRQVQLSVLEQQLRQSAEVFKSDKSRVLNLAKQVASELQNTRVHPISQRQNEERTHALMSIIKTLT